VNRGRSYINSTSSSVKNQLKTIKLRAKKVERESCNSLPCDKIMRNVAIVLAVVESRVFLIRRRSRIDIKQDLDTEEICSDIVGKRRVEYDTEVRLRAYSQME